MPNKRALVVGVDRYAIPGNDLTCAAADAKAIAELLSCNEDKTPNYECRVLADTMEDGSPITRAGLREACRRLFDGYKGDVLLYFSGHGVLTPFGGYLTTYDAENNDWGVPMQEVMQMACASHANDIVIVLDCCHSGNIANPSFFSHSGTDPLALLRENMTVLAASRASESAIEAAGHGLFTAAIIDALDGGGADHMGWVTAPSIYAYVERRFGNWDQRPVYKSHVDHSCVVRVCAPLIDRLKLREIVSIFPTEEHQYQLDPEFEPEDEYGNKKEPVNETKVELAQLFKDYRDAGLLKTTSGLQLYWAARQSQSVELTRRGREYWRLVANRRI